MKNYQYLDVITSFFIMSVVVSNIASSAKIIDLSISIGNIPLAFDAGTLLFPFSYILGGILSEVYGFQQAKRIIWLGFIALIFSALIFWIIGILPAEPTWESIVGNESYFSIMGGMSNGGIVLGSIIAYIIGELSNIFIIDRMKKLMHGKWLPIRTILSTFFGYFLDSFIFISVTCFFGVFPWSLFWTLILTNYILTVVFEIAFTPITYKFILFLKKQENLS